MNPDPHPCPCPQIFFWGPAQALIITRRTSENTVWTQCTVHGSGFSAQFESGSSAQCTVRIQCTVHGSGSSAQCTGPDPVHSARVRIQCTVQIRIQCTVHGSGALPVHTQERQGSSRKGHRKFSRPRPNGLHLTRQPRPRRALLGSRHIADSTTAHYILGASEITANLCSYYGHLYWEGCVICSIYLR